jgi:hypothetical protein
LPWTNSRSAQSFVAHSAIDGGVDDVPRAHDVRHHRLERVVFAGGNLLQRGGVHHDVHAPHRSMEPVAVADVADEKPHRRFVFGELPPHLELFQLVAGENDQFLRMVLLQYRAREFPAEAPGAPGDE